MSERGIDPDRTRIGQNVICRVGDPTNTNDLIRVGGKSCICRIRRTSMSMSMCMCMCMCMSFVIGHEHHLSNSP